MNFPGYLVGSIGGSSFQQNHDLEKPHLGGVKHHPSSSTMEPANMPFAPKSRES